MVLQERSLIGTLDVLDNVFLNAEIVSKGFVDRAAQAAEARQLFERLGIEPSVLKRRVSDISQLEQELVEIAKALRLAQKVLILDEPTAPLTARETETLFEVMRNVASLGIGIVLITHHLNEVFAVSDRVTALREGTVTLSAATGDTNLSEVTEAMLGRRLMRVQKEVSDSSTSEKLSPILQIEGLQVGEKLSSGVSFDVYPGEIVGVAGLAGSGRTTLLKTLFGVFHPTAGAMKLDGRPYEPATTVASIEQGVFLIPEDRGVHGLVLIHSIVDNVILPVLSRVKRRGMVARKKAAEMTRTLSETLGIRSRGIQQTVGELSGGNQQKVVLAKALATEPRLLLLDEPTFGVDVGAASDLITNIRKAVSGGTSAIWVTSDIHELLEVSDRVVVLAGGGVHSILSANDPEFHEAHVLQAVQRLLRASDNAGQEPQT
jgi:ribose transport system ATP-binding protein